MDEVLKFLKENPTYYLATAEGDQRRVSAPSAPLQNLKAGCIFKPAT